MKAAVFEAPHKLVIKEVPEPVPGDNEVIVKVHSCGVCATDVHTLEGEFISKEPYPLIPGHELSGEVVQTGKNVKDFKLGDKVAADPIIPCGECYYCKRNQQNHCENFEALGTTVPGGFAELVSVPAKNLHKFNNVSFEEAALAEPLACVIYGHQRARVNFGDDVLIFGAGPLGLLHLQLARHAGAARVMVCDLKESKLELAKELGAHQVINAGKENINDLLELVPHGFDMVIDATGVAKVVEDTVPFIKRTGKLMVFGVCPQKSTIKVNPYDIYRRDIEIIGVFALNKTLGKSLKLIDNGVINTKKIISDRMTLDQFGRALEMLKNGKAEGKIQINPQL
ncbi:MAG: hypothetical protein PWR10_2449 [Halanaerobiales bacterium]|nr:hypothetical protein [Halanaerobiales bacterium]